MKLRALITVTIAILVCLTQTSCKRTASDVWEDAKTAGRQLGRGVKTLAGERSVSRQVRSSDDFRGPQDYDFIPLRDEDISNRFYVERNAPQPSFEPGEPGSSLPGIDGFKSPTASEQKKIFKHVHFDTNEYSIRGSENKQIVTNIIDYLKKNPSVYLYVEGHCDQRGAAAYNLALGAKRSNAVRNQLVDNGISPERVHTISYGKERLVDEGTSAEAMQRNRRVEFKIYNQNSRG